jgi:hypothetical protein
MTALKVEVERRKVVKKKKQKNYFQDSLGAQIVENWVIGRIIQNATSIEQRKDNVLVTKIITYSLK